MMLTWYWYILEWLILSAANCTVYKHIKPMLHQPTAKHDTAARRQYDMTHPVQLCLVH